MVSDRSFKWLGLFRVLMNNSLVHSVSYGDLRFLDPISISEKTSCRKFSWTLEAARLVVYIITSLWDFFWSASQISKQSDNIKYTSRGFETDLSIIRLIGYWNRTLDIQEHTVIWIGICILLDMFYPLYTLCTWTTGAVWPNVSLCTNNIILWLSHH